MTIRTNILTILLTIAWTSFIAQSSDLDDIAQSYRTQAEHYQPYDYQDFDQLCNWQSVRVVTHAHVQIDIQGTLTELKAVDLALVQRDLGRVWADMKHETFELADRGYRFQRHTAIPYWPLQRWFDWEYNLSNAYDPGNCPSPCGGWYMEELTNGILYGRKQIKPGIYQVSFVRFLKWRNGPKY